MLLSQVNKKYVFKLYFFHNKIPFSSNNITAAHCIRQKGSKSSLEAEKIKVLLGVYNISDTSEQHRKELKVSSIYIHSDWDSEDYFRYAHDIALLKLESDNEFTTLIRPICLRTTEDLLNIKFGTVIGFNQSRETKVMSGILLKSQVPIVDHKIWIKRQWKIDQVYWNESFTAGSSETSFSSGDSGSGFYVKFTGRFYLRGLVSSTVIQEDSNNFTHNNFAIFTDVLGYMNEFIVPIIG